MHVNVVFTPEDADYTLRVVAKGDSEPDVPKDAVGFTHLTDDGKVVKNYGSVFIDRAKDSAIDKIHGGGTGFEQNEDMNLAITLGRAGAHEIGHYLLQQTFDRETIKGVMHARYHGKIWFTPETAKEWYFDKDRERKLYSFTQNLIKQREEYKSKFKPRQ